MAWLYLFAAGIFEMTGVTMINKFHHDKSLAALLLVGGGFSLSFIFLAFAMETLPMGTAYAVWTGIGAAGGAVLGMIWYNESKDIRRIFCIVLIIVGAAGLKIVS
ncbi:DMT family transporter [Alteribacillus sp. HJP-4]|uniref:DMT family transporter n=1 Tax=Alteribacillus sp. HJP-4 TaxID=2775394 RepID=UPI0035CD28D6